MTGHVNILGHREEKGIDKLVKQAGKDSLISSVIEGKDVSKINAVHLNLEWGLDDIMIYGFSKDYTYEQSLERLRELGYERHPRPWEFSKVIIDYLEGKLKNMDFALKFENIYLTGHSRWLNAAAVVAYNQLTIYGDPIDIEWDYSTKRGYKFDGRYGHSIRTFDLPPKEYKFSIIRADLSEVDKRMEGLIPFLFGREFEELPKELQDKGVIGFSTLGPNPIYVRKHTDDGELYIGSGESFIKGASPGVRLRK